MEETNLGTFPKFRGPGPQNQGGHGLGQIEFDWGPASKIFNQPHTDVEAVFQSSKSTIAETGMGVTSRP